MSHQLNEMEADRDQTQSRILQLQKYLADCEEGLFFFFFFFSSLYPFIHKNFFTYLFSHLWFLLV